MPAEPAAAAAAAAEDGGSMAGGWEVAGIGDAELAGRW